MRIGRTLPPAASPIYFSDIVNGIFGLLHGEKELDRLALEFRAYFDVKHCFFVSSGKTALTVILNSLKPLYPQRNKVIVPAFNCYSVPSAIERAGLQVEPCDVDPATLDFSPEHLARLLKIPDCGEGNNGGADEASTYPICIIPTHFFGIASDVARVRQIIGTRDIPIVEDAAQVIGVSSNGAKLGTIGDVGFFSLGRGKSFSCLEGGVIITNKDDIAEELRKKIYDIPRCSSLELLKLLFFSFAIMLFQHPLLFWIPKSLPFLRLGETIYDPAFKMRKFSSFQAGLARNWKSKIQKFFRVRNEKANQWKEMLEKDFIIGRIAQENMYSPVRFPCKVASLAKRDELLRASEELGLGIMLTYPQPINDIIEKPSDDIPKTYAGAEELTKTLVTLPNHLYIKNSDMKKIVKLLGE